MHAMDTNLLLTICLIAFLAESIDSSIGMGYGTILTPLLLVMGFTPLQVVPAILLSEFITGIAAALTHNAMGNVSFMPKLRNPKINSSSFAVKKMFYGLKKHIPFHLKIVILISLCSIFGTAFATVIAINIPALYVKLYIAIIVLLMGINILLSINKKYSFTWKKMAILGLIASFNKGISGGGYGPVITSGQIMAGINPKNSIGITSFSEGLTCLFGVLCYYYLKRDIDMRIAPALITGALLAVPMTGIYVKKIQIRFLKILIGISTLTLGTISLFRIYIY